MRLGARNPDCCATVAVPVTVSLELEWVLWSSFGFGKESVVHTLSRERVTGPSAVRLLTAEGVAAP